LLRRQADVTRAAERVLARVGLSARRNAVASVLAYGEQRALEIALCLALEPRLMLLDEPCAGLNSEDTDRAVALIRDVSVGRTLVMIEHDMPVVFSLADRISVLHEGRILATGKPADIRGSKAVQLAYLGTELDVDLG
jgi:branched-chain amino acid transport system ATP-binding protein